MQTDEFPKYLVLSFILVFSLFLAFKAPYIYSYSHSANYENVSVDTRVNISESIPFIIGINIDDNDNVTLNAGMTYTVICNITVQDWNGWNDVTAVNATFWDANNASMSDALNNNTLYRNTSCTLDGNDGLYRSYWLCGFDVWYHANNGSNWICNATAIDSYYPTNNNYQDSKYNITTIYPLYAVNVTSLIDYGDMAVGDTSATSETANVTNFGNMPVNVTVFGWGGSNVSDPRGDGLAFICEQGNITIESEHFSVSDVAWGSMTNLSASPQLVDGLTIAKQITTPVINTTYWRLYVPPNPYGVCNGTVVFSAQIS